MTGKETSTEKGHSAELKLLSTGIEMLKQPKWDSEQRQEWSLGVTDLSLLAG
jgi:hypothetical protein